MIKYPKTLVFIVVLIFVVLIGTYSLKLIAGACDEVCSDPGAPCCCEAQSGYYLSSYSCGCAGGQLQWQKCHWVPEV